MNYLQKSLTISLTLFALSAHAALFDDAEARKKIRDVEAKSLANHEAQAVEIEDLKKRVTLQSQSMLDQQNEIELLKKEVAQLRGGLEVANHALETAEQRQKDLYADTDARIRSLEGSGTAETGVDQTAPVIDTEDAKVYKEAYAFSQEAKHKEAFAAFDHFLKTYPDSTLIPDALYGLGYSQFALRNYKSSVASQQKLIDSYPDSSKVPNAMYSIANSQIQLGQVENAKKVLRDLIEKYPDADVIPNAQKRLKVLETIK